VSYEVFPVDEHHDQDVPVELKNSGYVTPFQNTVMGLMSLPKYGSFDPTWVVALFVPLFFGIIMADIGYGLLFLCLRCIYRSMDPPRLIGSAATLLGYVQRRLSGAPVVLPAEVVSFLKTEQQHKLLNSLRGAHVRHQRPL